MGVLEVAVHGGVAQRPKLGARRNRREEERRLSALRALTWKCELESAQPPRRAGDIGLVQGEPDRVGAPNGAVLVRLGARRLDDGLVPSVDHRGQLSRSGVRTDFAVDFPKSGRAPQTPVIELLAIGESYF